MVNRNMTWRLALLGMVSGWFAVTAAAAEVTTLTLQAESVPSWLTLDGKVEPVHQGTVAAQTSGRVVRMLVDVNDQVKEGQPLLEISGNEQSASVAASQAALARAEEIDYNKLYEADRLLHETWFAAMGKMYLWRTLQNAHADYSRFRMLDTMTSGGLDEVIADHQNIIAAIERCDLAAFEPLVERHLYGGIRRLGSKLTEEYADYFEPEK